MHAWWVFGFGAHKFAFAEETIDYIGGIVKSGLWVPFDLILEGLTWVHFGYIYSLKGSKFLGASVFGRGFFVWARGGLTHSCFVNGLVIVCWPWVVFHSQLFMRFFGPCLGGFILEILFV